ncbi:MAG: DUF1501 domain-containing protein [Planctomycetes bacterium]|nr:DUF1501 domain-containing protein [Planctomycetota bacterium]
MLNLLGASQRFCDGLNRRSFLKIGAFGTGLALSDMLRLRAQASAGGGAATTSPKAAIMIFLPGGPSHLDMWDLKPEAPAEYRGEFRPIATNVPGIQICEHMPRQARIFDKLAVVRSLVSVGEHSDSECMTGYSEQINRSASHPSFGAVLSRLRGNDQPEIPAFVSLRGQTIGCEPGFLGVANRAFTPDGAGLSNLTQNPDVNSRRGSDRRNLLSRFDSVRRDIDASGTMRGLDAFTTRAFDMIASGTTRRALDLDREDPRSRDRYRGIEQFLTARRLIEAGVGCVTLGYGGWDTHSENFMTLRRQLPELDRGIANLIEDLHDRGMDRDVVTVVWGEFGRTPRIGDVTADGRGHWPPVMSALVAGGGLRMGQAIGSSNARGELPRDRRCTPSQLLSTIYRAINVDPSQTFPNQTGRPMYVLEDRDPISELL